MGRNTGNLSPRDSIYIARHGSLPVVAEIRRSNPETALGEASPVSTFNSRASSDTLSQLFIRSSAISRNALGYLLTRFLGALQLLSLPSVAILRVSVQGGSPDIAEQKIVSGGCSIRHNIGPHSCRRAIMGSI
jgi:hypothetical protein